MAQPTRTGMDEDGDLALAEAVCQGRAVVDDPLDPLQLDEVVPRAHRPELPGAALTGPLGDGRGIGARQAAAGLGALEVVLCRPDAGAPAQHLVELRISPAVAPLLADPGRDGTRDLVHQRLPAPRKLVRRQRERKQADAAVDVVANAPWGDDAVGELHRRDAADWEPVALVGIGHRERRPSDTRQRGDVLELLERAVARDRLEQLVIGEHSRGNAHVRPSLCRDLPDNVGDFSALRHRARPEHASRRLRSARTRAGGA
jgi:hypothetical protein